MTLTSTNRSVRHPLRFLPAPLEALFSCIFLIHHWIKYLIFLKIFNADYSNLPHLFWPVLFYFHNRFQSVEYFSSSLRDVLYRWRLFNYIFGIWEQFQPTKRIIRSSFLYPVAPIICLHPCRVNCTGPLNAGHVMTELLQRSYMSQACACCFCTSACEVMQK